MKAGSTRNTEATREKNPAGEKEMSFSVREMREEDIDLITAYWLESDPAFLQGMGVDLLKVPSGPQWRQMLKEQLDQAYPDKKSYCLIWLAAGRPIGHCNVNKIVYGEEAFMHLHIWQPDVRKKGSGTLLVRKSLPWFFKNLNLKKIFCEPYALNPAPNRTLEKAEFDFIKTYITIPGWINIEQPVNRWEMSYEKFSRMQQA